MISKILNTISARFVGVAISMLIIILTSNYLGSEGRGYISILTFDIAIVTILSNIIGGTALVFLIPRYNFIKLYVLSVLWNLIVCIISWPILIYTGLLPEIFSEHFFILCFFQNLINTHQNIFLAKQQIKWYNYSPLLMNGINLILFFYLFHSFNNGINSFVISLYVAYITTALLLTIPISRHFNKEKNGSYTAIIKQCFNLGLWAQAGNAMQLLNYRVCYWLLNSFVGISAVGIFSVIMAIIDTALIASRSIATVQYASIANSHDNEDNYMAAKKMAKNAMLITFVIFVFAMLTPNYIYSFVFGKDFSDVRYHLIYALIGITFFGYSTILAHYYSGIGKYRINTFAALMGLIITLIFGYLVVPHWGISGACITISMSFIANSLLLIYLFRKRKFVINV